VELTEKERFPDSKPARQKPFRMYEDNTVISVKLTDLEKGWNLDNTGDTQVNCNFYSKKKKISMNGDLHIACTATVRIS